MTTVWPPVWNVAAVTPFIGSMRIAWGGSGVEGETQLASMDAFGMGAWKMGSGDTSRSPVIAANPNVRMLAYKTMWELGPAANSAAAIAGGQTCISYAEAQAWEAANPGDLWILRDGGGTPITDSYGMHFGDLAKPSLQARALANLRYFLQTWSAMRNGFDGLWFDNFVPYVPASGSSYGAVGSPTTASRAAALAWIAAVVGVLKSEGWYITGNALGDWSGESNNYQGTKDWHNQIAPYINGPWTEGATFRVNASGAMRTGAAWVNITKAEQLNAEANGSEFWPGLRLAGTLAADLQNVIFAKASFLVNWNGIKRSILTGGGLDLLPATSPFDTYSPVWRKDTGLPTTPTQIGGEQLATYQFRRQYQKAYVWVNADPSSSLVISTSPDGRAYKDYNGNAVTFPITLSAASGLILYSDAWIGGGSGGAAAVKTDGYSDDFNDGVIASQWTITHPGASTVTEASGLLTLAVPLNAGVYCKTELSLSDLTGSAAYASINPGTFTVNTQEADFGVKTADNQNRYFFNIIGGATPQLYAYKKTSGVQVAIGNINYDATNHRWLRIRESAGTVYFETAPDSSGSPGTWTQRFTVVTDWTPNNVVVFIDAGQDNTSTAAISVAVNAFNKADATAATYSAEILAEANLLHYFRLGESAGAGTIADSKTPGSVIFTARAGITQGATGLITGDSDKAATGDGSATGYADQTTGTNFGPTSGSWAIEAWFNNTGAGTPTPNDYGAILGRDWTHRLLVGTGGTGSQKILAQFSDVSLFSSGDAAQGSRHQVVLEYDSVNNLLKLYLDGAHQADATPTTAPTLAGTYALFGYDIVDVNPGANYVFKGTLDEVAVYSGLLGATKISSHYTNGTT